MVSFISNEIVVKNCLRILSNCATSNDFNIIQKLIEEKLIDRLYLLLTTLSQPEIVKECLWCLSNLMADNAAVSSLVIENEQIMIEV